jgi:hypothetical protein
VLTSVSAVSSQTEADLRAQLVAAREDVISAQTALASASERHAADAETLRAQLEAARDGLVSAQTALASASERHVAEVDKLRAQLAVEQELTEQKGAEWQRQLQQAQMENAEALGDVSRNSWILIHWGSSTPCLRKSELSYCSCSSVRQATASFERE